LDGAGFRSRIRTGSGTFSRRRGSFRSRVTRAGTGAEALWSAFPTLVSAPTPIRAMSVSVKTLFFASYRDLLGISQLELDLGDGATVEDLVRALRGRGAPFDILPPRPAVAVNRSYAGPGEELRTGDEVAFIPPVAGG